MTQCRTGLKCCPNPHGDDYMQDTAPKLLQEFVGRCYMDTDDQFNPTFTQPFDLPTWAGNFNAYCTLTAAAEECEQRPLCDGLQLLAATGTVFRFLAYSTTNPTALPPTDRCDPPRQDGRNSTLGKGSKAAKKWYQPHKSTHRANAGQQKVFMGNALLYSGMILRANSHLHDVQFEGGRFEYVTPIRRDCLEGQTGKCGNADGESVCGCWDDTTDEYVGPPGWEEVDMSAVPTGTPPVDGRLNTYNLKWY